MSIHALAAIGALLIGASPINAAATAVATTVTFSALPCGVALRLRAPSGTLGEAKPRQLTVALVTSFPDSAAVAVLRRPAGNSDADLALVRASDATPRLLSAIACAAYRSLGVRGSAPLVRVSIAFRRDQPLPSIGLPDSGSASAFLDALREQPMRDIPGVGRVRSARLWLVTMG